MARHTFTPGIVCLALTFAGSPLYAQGSGASQGARPVEKKLIAVGWDMPNAERLRANYTVTRRWTPRMDAGKRAEGIAGWHRGVDRTLELAPKAATLANATG